MITTCFKFERRLSSVVFYINIVLDLQPRHVHSDVPATSSSLRPPIHILIIRSYQTRRRVTLVNDLGGATVGNLSSSEAYRYNRYHRLCITTVVLGPDGLQLQYVHLSAIQSKRSGFLYLFTVAVTYYAKCKRPPCSQ